MNKGPGLSLHISTRMDVGIIMTPRLRRSKDARDDAGDGAAPWRERRERREPQNGADEPPATARPHATGE